jgi:putative ABC transport system permease protein
MISNGRANTIFWAKGYDIQAGALMRGHKWGWDVVAGLPLQLASGNENIVIGRSLARILECDVPSAGRKLYSAEGGYAEEKRPYDCPQPQLQLGVTTPNGQQNAIDMNVVGVVDGIFKEVDTKYVMMSLPLMQRLFDTKGVSFYSVQLQRGADVPAFLSSLTAAAREQGHHLRAQRWQDHPEGDLYLRTMELLSIFRNFVIGIMIGITGLSVFNAFLKSVNERTREIGTMRSLGYRRRSIIGLFGLEAVYLSVGGCAAGAVCGLVATHLINSAAILYKAGILAEPVPFRLAYDFPIYLTSAAFLVAVGVGAAVLAVHSTVTRPIAENLVHA